jgi:hypothetical protein
MIKTVTFLLLTILIFSCKSTNYNPATYKGDQIVTGSSGGVTGAIREYALFENGQLFVCKGISGDWKALKNVKGSKVRAFFNKAKEIGLDTLHFNHPGNMTYFMIYKSQGQSNEVKWGKSDNPAPRNIQAFYQELISGF